MKLWMSAVASMSLFFFSDTARAQQTISDSASVAGLPLIEMPAKTQGHTLALFMTGDGGWATLDRRVAAQLSSHGISVIGLNSRNYLAHEKSPDQVGRDVARIARHYLAQWHLDSLIIAGYSRGADLAPFATSRLPDDLKKKVVLVAMLGLSHDAGFEFHLIDLVASPHRKSDRPTLEELAKVKDVKMMCVYGADEDDSACRDAPAGMMQQVKLPGGHHFDDNFEHLGDLIIDAATDDSRALPAEH